MNIKKIILEEINDFDWVNDITNEVTSCHQLGVGMKITIGNGEINPNGDDDLPAEVVTIGVEDDYGLTVLVAYDELNVNGHNGDGEVECRNNNCWYIYCHDFLDAKINIIKYV